jgi:hypothetical protein
MKIIDDPTVSDLGLRDCNSLLILDSGAVQWSYDHLKDRQNEIHKHDYDRPYAR